MRRYVNTRLRYNAMNPRVLDIPSSLIRQIAAKRKATSIDLGLGEPSLPPNLEHFEFAMQRVRDHGMKYTVNAGESTLRDAVAKHYRYPDMLRAENVCITTGSQEAMYVALMTVLNPATDELLVIEPTFPSYAKMATLGGVAVRTVSMNEADDFAFDAQRILAGVTNRTRAIVIASPNNPTGRVMSRECAAELVRELETRPGEPIWLIHDEIYREQCFTNNAAWLAHMYPHTIVTNSVSKSNALTGLRLGWILGPQTFIEHAIKAHAWVTSCADAFAQSVALHIFTTEGGIQEHAAWYRNQRAAVMAALRESGLRFIATEGSFYACVKTPGSMSSLDASLALIDKSDVLTIPGEAFGSCFDGWLRLSWVAPIGDVRDGIRRIAAFRH